MGLGLDLEPAGHTVCSPDRCKQRLEDALHQYVVQVQHQEVKLDLCRVDVWDEVSHGEVNSKEARQHPALQARPPSANPMHASCRAN